MWTKTLGEQLETPANEVCLHKNITNGQKQYPFIIRKLSGAIVFDIVL